jgi:ribonuclease T2
METFMSATSIKSIFTVLLGLLVALGASSLIQARSHGKRGENNAPGHFDYYLMSLSWSPSFCETHPNETDQCGARKFGFVLHGLWPQNRNGTWPEHCSSDKTLDEKTVEHMLPLMPSRHLIEHEWETHGACTGLDPKQYFDLADQAYSGVKIPPALVAPTTPPALSAKDVVQAFIQANPLLDERMISVACREGSELEEVRICIDKDNMSVKACGGRVRNTCRYGNLRIPATR